MTIAFACPSCGKAFEVAAALAGRTGKCKSCGRPMTIPAYQHEDDVATEGYILMDGAERAAEAEPEPMMAGESVYTGTMSDPVEYPNPRPRTTLAPKKRKKRRQNAEPFLARNGRLLVGVTIALAVVLGLVALLVPGGKLFAAIIVMIIGSVMILVGNFVGLWAAFQEDSLYGILYLLVPFYSAYYILTRWDDMWPWFASMTIGAVLVGASLGVLEATATAPAHEGEARAVRARGGLTLVEIQKFA